MCKASTKFKNATIKDVPYINTIINNAESTNYGIKFPYLSIDNLQLQLFTDASFNNLPNGGSQAGKIFFWPTIKVTYVSSTRIHLKLIE